MLLSPEVVDHIISYLRADISTLKSCSQAHPLLSGHAERYLYYTTTVDIKPGDNADITELSQRFLENPQIRNYVRILKINMFEHLVEEVNMEATLSILSSLPLLDSVALAMRPYKSWDTIHKRFQLAFIEILQQSSIRDIYLEGLSSFPLSVFDTCLGITTLSLCNCKMSANYNSSTTCLSLESLSIQGTYDETLFFWAINQVGRLTSLKLGPQVETFRALPNLLETCSGSLTSLELDIHNENLYEYFYKDENYYRNAFPGNSIENIEFEFDLSVLTHLENLTIWTTVSATKQEASSNGKRVYNDYAFYSAIGEIARLINSSASSLQQVVLKLLCDEFSNIDSLVEINWYPLIALGRSPTCPHIDLHICCLEFDTYYGFPPEEITASLANHKELMVLVDQGVFSIKLDDFWESKSM